MQAEDTQSNAESPFDGAPDPTGLARGVDLASALLGLAYLGLFLALSVQRVAYPFELEWMEGGTLQHLLRVLEGEPLFVAPSIDFVPFPYPPFYYYLAAAISPIFGEGFFTLRLISLLASLGSSFLVFRWVARETANVAWGAACSGVFLATWYACGLYFDVARLDALFCFLLMLWLYGLRFHRTTRGLVLAAIVAFAMVMTKQTGAVVFAPVALWCFATDWNANGRALSRLPSYRLTTTHVAPVALLVGLGTVLLNGVVDEHFLRHIVGAQAQHGILPWKIGLFFGGDLFATLPFACLATLGWLWIARRGANASPARGADCEHAPTASLAFHVVVLLGILFTCMVPRIKVSGAANNLIPAYAWLAVLLGVGLGRMREATIARLPVTRHRTTHLALSLCLLAQLLLLFHTPRGYLPTAADRAAGERFVEQLRRMPGDVLMPGQGYLATRAGKRTFAHQMPVSDYAKSGLPDAPKLQTQYEEAVRAGRFAVIVDTNTSFIRRTVGDAVLERRYRLAGWAFTDSTVFLPISGAQIRPGKIWVRRGDDPTPAAP